MEIAETRERLERDWLTRPRLERAENWREVVDKMPYLSFPRGWKVAIIPPFAGAVARFLVSKDKARVSVYADFYERLGCFGEPHWEIYPDARDDNARFALDDTGSLIAAIGKSLTSQNRKSANPRTPQAQ